VCPGTVPGEHDFFFCYGCRLYLYRFLDPGETGGQSSPGRELFRRAQPVAQERAP